MRLETIQRLELSKRLSIPSIWRGRGSFGGTADGFAAARVECREVMRVVFGLRLEVY